MSLFTYHHSWQGLGKHWRLVDTALMMSEPHDLFWRVYGKIKDKATSVIIYDRIMENRKVENGRDC